MDIRTKLSGDHKKISRVPFMSRDIRNKKRITTMTKKTISGRRQMVLSTFSPGDRKKWKLEYGENKVDVRTGRVNFTVMESIPVLNTEGFIFSFSQGNFQKIGSKLYIADIRWANKIGLRSISTEGGETLYDFGVFEVTKDVNGLPVLIKSLNRSNEWNLRLTSLPAVNITPKIKTDQGEVTMKWQKPSDNEVEGYSIWKKTSDDGEYVNIKKNNHGKIFSEPLDTSGDGITTLSYQVGFKKRDGSVKYFSRPVSVTLLLNSPDAPRMTSYRGAPVVNWKRIPPGVDGINIYRREEGKKLKKLRSFKYETEYEDSSISSNCCKKYLYRTRYYIDSPEYVESPFSNAQEVSIVCKDKDYGLKTNSKDSSSIQISWENGLKPHLQKVIYRKVEGEIDFSKIKGPSSMDTPFEDGKLSEGTSYEYKIGLVRKGETEPCSFSSVVEGKTKPKPLQIEHVNKFFEKDYWKWEQIIGTNVKYKIIFRYGNSSLTVEEEVSKEDFKNSSYKRIYSKNVIAKLKKAGVEKATMQVIPVINGVKSSDLMGTFEIDVNSSDYK